MLRVILLAWDTLETLSAAEGSDHCHAWRFPPLPRPKGLVQGSAKVRGRGAVDVSLLDRGPDQGAGRFLLQPGLHS